MAVGVVQEPEVVDVDQRDADRGAGRARGLDLVGQQGDDRAVVEHLGQRVAAGRLDELGMLPGQPRLRRSEEEQQHAGQQGAGGEGHEHDVAPGFVQAGEDGRGIAPQADDRDRLAAILDDRQVLLDDARDTECVADGLEGTAGLDQGAHRASRPTQRLRQPRPRRAARPPRGRRWR